MRAALLLIGWLVTTAALAQPHMNPPLVGPGVTGQKLANGQTAGSDIGAGPHEERTTAPAPREDVDEIPPASRPVNRTDNGGSASTGGSSPAGARAGSSGADNDALEADEARANRNKEKFKQRPGYRDDAPQPRAMK
jgi:hypothetical protein